MNNALTATLIFSLGLLCACTKGSTEAEKADDLRLIEAASPVFSPVAGEPDEFFGDATAFLVGEFYVSNGYTAYFDGRGSVTMVAPDGSSNSGTYTLREEKGRKATVHIDRGLGEELFSYDLISDCGGFTLTDSNGNLLVFVLKTYE